MGSLNTLGVASLENRRLQAPAVCQVFSLGLWPFGEAWNLQQALVARRRAGNTGDVLLLLEHLPVITLGRRASREHLRTGEDELRREGIDIVETDRGGSITFHGPGQLVGYPILDLSRIRKDVVWYVRTLEQALIRTLGDFGIRAQARTGLTGVWVGMAKIASIGVHISRWITSHGFAVNVDNDLAAFRHIVPCGIHGCKMTSVREQLGHPIRRSVMEASVARHLGDQFGLTMQWCPPECLERSSSCPPPKS